MCYVRTFLSASSTSLTASPTASFGFFSFLLFPFFAPPAFFLAPMVPSRYTLWFQALGEEKTDRGTSSSEQVPRDRFSRLSTRSSSSGLRHVQSRLWSVCGGWTIVDQNQLRTTYTLGLVSLRRSTLSLSVASPASHPGGQLAPLKGSFVLNQAFRAHTSAHSRYHNRCCKPGNRQTKTEPTKNINPPRFLDRNGFIGEGMIDSVPAFRGLQISNIFFRKRIVVVALRGEQAATAWRGTSQKDR